MQEPLSLEQTTVNLFGCIRPYYNVWDAKGYAVMSNHPRDNVAPDKEHAERIVACVNACAGVDTASLKDGCLKSLSVLAAKEVAHAATLQRQLDEVWLLFNSAALDWQFKLPVEALGGGRTAKDLYKEHVNG